jgi:flagellar biosynthesis protein FlhG
VGPVRDPALDAALEAERAMLREELAREITAETQFTGEILNRVRQSLGVSLEDIATRTKISAQYLAAIEQDAFAELPAVVYLRGFLREVAKYLKLDTAQVTKTYLRRYRHWRRARENAAP